MVCLQDAKSILCTVAPGHQMINLNSSTAILSPGDHCWDSAKPFKWFTEIRCPATYFALGHLLKPEMVVQKRWEFPKEHPLFGNDQCYFRTSMVISDQTWVVVWNIFEMGWNSFPFLHHRSCHCRSFVTHTHTQRPWTLDFAGESPEVSHVIVSYKVVYCLRSIVYVQMSPKTGPIPK